MCQKYLLQEYAINAYAQFREQNITLGFKTNYQYIFIAHSMLSTELGTQETVVNRSDFLLSWGLGQWMFIHSLTYDYILKCLLCTGHCDSTVLCYTGETSGWYCAWYLAQNKYLTDCKITLSLLFTILQYSTLSKNVEGKKPFWS